MDVKIGLKDVIQTLKGLEARFMANDQVLEAVAIRIAKIALKKYKGEKPIKVTYISADNRYYIVAECPDEPTFYEKMTTIDKALEEEKGMTDNA